MKTLYQRLSEENKSKIEDASKIWPTTMGNLIIFLQYNYSWGEMQMHNAMALNGVLDETKPFDLSTFINFFEND